MFIITLKFSNNKEQASQFMEGHNQWIEQGFNDGVFLLAGSLGSNLGGGVMAYNILLSDLQNRVKDDPFVAEGVVSAEIIEIAPAKTDERLNFLVE
jgi:uncharacterized protein YciI